MRKLKLEALPDLYTVCRLDRDRPLPGWLDQTRFHAVVRTDSELSILCPQPGVPEGVQQQEGGWRMLRVAGSLDFSETGVLSAIAGPLANAGISIFAISTYDTDYVLVRKADLGRALEALSRAGHDTRGK
jgi:hypothetical protein